MKSRLLMAFVAGLATLPAAALAEDTYSNARYGFQFTVPDGFMAVDSAPDNGDGQTFLSTDQRASLTVFGANVMAPAFAAEVANSTQMARANGWAITYEAGQPGWGVYSGMFGQQILYVRMEAQCNDTQYAAVWLLFDAADRAQYEPLTGQLADRLKTSTSCN
ncbi:MAG: hypothetical protein H6873_04640 [Hyphomicrobiaceae bacterium]|nr:hypothetical protein [Hyphomicrobiaceae bacterium]